MVIDDDEKPCRPDDGAKWHRYIIVYRQRRFSVLYRYVHKSHKGFSTYEEAIALAESLDCFSEEPSTLNCNGNVCQEAIIFAESAIKLHQR